MKVNIQAVNFNVDRKLVDFINERLEKLEQYYDKIVGIDVSLRTENTSDKENKSVDILIKIPGDDLIVKKTAKTFEEAADTGADALERLLIKRKEKVKAYYLFKKKHKKTFVFLNKYIYLQSVRNSGLFKLPL